MPRECQPAFHSASAAQFLWQHLPRYAAAERKENPCEASTILQTRSASLGSARRGRQQRLNEIPQGIGKQRSAHGLSILALLGEE
jgi:hypothetical protein